MRQVRRTCRNIAMNDRSDLIEEIIRIEYAMLGRVHNLAAPPPARSSATPSTWCAKASF